MTARVRALLGLAVSAAFAVLLPSLTGAEPTSALVAVALLVVVVAALALRTGVVGLTAGSPLLPSRAADEDRSLGTEQATDPVHSPLGPRAPGLV